MNQEAINGQPRYFEQESPAVFYDGSGGRVYHYTSLGTLELILSNKTLRFTRVDGLDDGMEAATFPGDLSRKFFVSCWTTDPSDTPMAWRRFYTACNDDPATRVRISIARKPFRYRCLGVVGGDGREAWLSAEFAQPFTFSSRFTSSYVIDDMNMTQQSWFGRPVAYVDQVENFYADRIIRHADGGLELRAVQDFATHKERGWEEQSEYRFVLCAAPPIPGLDGSVEVPPFMEWEIFRRVWCANSIRYGTYPGVDRIDMPIHMDAIGDMEIMLSPTFSEENIGRVRDLIQGFLPRATIMRSRYHGKMLR